MDHRRLSVKLKREGSFGEDSTAENNSIEYGVFEKLPDIIHTSQHYNSLVSSLENGTLVDGVPADRVALSSRWIASGPPVRWSKQGKYRV